METQANKEILDVIYIALKRLQLPEESADLLTGLISLSISSKTMKNIFTDEVLINMSNRFLRGTLVINFEFLN
jgi:hypothetical protein